MQGSIFPASIADSFQEAVGYEQLQWQRRRGVYGGLLALGWILLGLSRFLGALSWAWWAAIGVLVAGLALTLVVRRRPAWKGVFIEGGDDLAKLLVPRTGSWPKWVRLTVFAVVLFAFVSLRELSRYGLPDGIIESAEILGLAAALFVVLRRIGDQAMQAGLVITAALVVPIGLGIIPPAAGLAVWALALGTNWLLIALVRVFGPRRWLVR
ncbi:MAG TPA: hypothetical protein VM327_06560 [Candidatus Thermoplasmatota archaeon]|nr:hypothetical protein [Candidatus Thermoplasmatota archaeon]